MRTMIRSKEFDEFYSTLPANVQNKVKYAMNIIADVKVVNTKLVKKLIDSDFYELRISVGNEYRVILFTIDHENFIEAEQILLLNGFYEEVDERLQEGNTKGRTNINQNATMRPKIDINKLKHLPTTEDMLTSEYGAKGTVSREEFDAKSRAWYYAEVLKNARKAAGITQQQLAQKIGKKREYVAMLEKGETDMQLSTFIMISEAVGLKFALTY